MRARQLFPELTPCDPLATEHDDIQNHFIRLLIVSAAVFALL